MLRIVLLITSIAYLLTDIWHYFRIRIDYNYLNETIVYEAYFESEYYSFTKWLCIISIVVAILSKRLLNRYYLSLLAGLTLVGLFGISQLENLLRGSILFNWFVPEIIGLLSVIWSFTCLYKSEAKLNFIALIMNFIILGVILFYFSQLPIFIAPND